MGIAVENILIRFNGYKRNIEIKKIAWQNRLAVMAAGIYEDPIAPVNQATDSYISMLDMVVDKSKDASANYYKQDANRKLVAEYEALFGKME